MEQADPEAAAQAPSTRPSKNHPNRQCSMSGLNDPVAQPEHRPTLTPLLEDLPISPPFIRTVNTPLRVCECLDATPTPSTEPRRKLTSNASDKTPLETGSTLNRTTQALAIAQIQKQMKNRHRQSYISIMTRTTQRPNCSWALTRCNLPSKSYKFLKIGRDWNGIQCWQTC